MSDAKASPGAEKVAAFLLSLDRQVAHAVLKNLDDKVVSEVATAMTELGDEFQSVEAVSALYRDLAIELNTPRGITAADSADLQEMLEASLGAERAELVITQIEERRLIERPFLKIEGYHPQRVAAALADESPAAIALVLAHVDPALSAEVISGLEQEFALQVVTRMATLIPPGTDTLRTIATEFEEKVKSCAEGMTRPQVGSRLKTIAEMLNYTQQEMERSLLEGLEKEDEEMVGEIREHMFTWTDLAEVDKRAMQKILASVDTRTLAVSLKACPADVEDNVMGNLSSRVRDMVSEERELAGPVPMTEVLMARGQLLKGVHGLIESGEFSPTRSGEDLVS